MQWLEAAGAVPQQKAEEVAKHARIPARAHACVRVWASGCVRVGCAGAFVRVGCVCACACVHLRVCARLCVCRVHREVVGRAAGDAGLAVDLQDPRLEALAREHLRRVRCNMRATHKRQYQPQRPRLVDEHVEAVQLEAPALVRAAQAPVSTP